MADSKSEDEQASPRWVVATTIAFGLGLVVVVALANSGTVTSQLLSIVSKIPGRDKTVHFLLMGTMALLLNLSWNGARWQLGPLPLLKGSVVVAALVTLEELSQLFVPIRSFSVQDLAYDYLGIVLIGHCALLYVWWARRKSRAAAAAPYEEPDAGPR